MQRCFAPSQSKSASSAAQPASGHPQTIVRTIIRTLSLGSAARPPYDLDFSGVLRRSITEEDAVASSSSNTAEVSAVRHEASYMCAGDCIVCLQCKMMWVPNRAPHTNPQHCGTPMSQCCLKYKAMFYSNVSARDVASYADVWWTTLLVPVSQMVRSPLCSDECLLEYLVEIYCPHPAMETPLRHRMLAQLNKVWKQFSYITGETTDNLVHANAETSDCQSSSLSSAEQSTPDSAGTQPVCAMPSEVITPILRFLFAHNLETIWTCSQCNP